jgi:hypothetical protein
LVHALVKERHTLNDFRVVTNQPRELADGMGRGDRSKSIVREGFDLATGRNRVVIDAELGCAGADDPGRNRGAAAAHHRTLPPRNHG